MELRQVRYVLAVAEERSFSRAANRLHLAQPSLSQQIAKLEKLLGVTLFHRLPQHVELTDAGQRFVQVAQTLVDMSDGLEREMRSYAVGESGKLMVGSLPITGAYVLPHVISAFTKRFPGVELQLVEDTSSHLEQLLVRGKIDVSLLTMPIGDLSIETIPAINEEIFLAVPPQHPLAEREEIDLAELSDQPFILLKEGQGFRTISLRLCELAGFRPRIVFESSNIQTVQSLVSAGMGFSFAPKMITLAPGSIEPPVYVRLTSKPSRTLVVAYRKDRPLSKPAEAFVQILVDQGGQI
ncbi:MULTISPECIES: LysR family transcriptional regulator [Brevibacillus]|uniref:LysR family transcriptional regulator n=1 Tax=Brevibacillus invocatus TaxID=173959 RepID=A0A3M8CHM2_9BACL|nr:MULTISPECIES: LysR family transcriptional regulator [Brevibacillus]CFJ30087.1 LysR family transcriptional regulator [Mycobacterium tuberculosis]MCM3077826.1 LysR family transcriptional regulator [Brevibacillus invocatus]MCM3428100.1 LysR family transcriptional regulator [Brevibacillus invocatus]MDH4616085.1 LysR family transcriptional regulator [Brevibacillus sp. AY1]RNB75286.1 LysR family transcriptional regulator [Brevibacillus invocatus]